MAGNTNKDKDKDPEIDAVLDETPPDINEPIVPEDEETAIPKDEILPDADNDDPNPDPEPVVQPVVDQPAQDPETQEEKDQRYRAQQAEAQIQNERTKALTDKVDEASKITDPTAEELKSFVAQDGINWEQLTNFEQATAKRTYLAEKRFTLVSEAVQAGKKADEWAKTVDDFIDSTDSKPEYVEIGGHETDFRKFAMKESHRGTPVDILMGAFLHSLPPAKPNRGSLFNRGGGGEKTEVKTGIVDADQASALRKNDPREYARQVKAGKIKIEV